MMTGIAASPGIAIGKALVIQSTPLMQATLAQTGDPASERNRFEQALEASKNELRQLEAQTAERLGTDKAAIFGAHVLILEDPALIDAVLGGIAEGRSALDAVSDVMAQFVAMFQEMEDPYMRERAADVEDVGRRLVQQLLGTRGPNLAELTEKVVVIADSLTPSDTAVMDPAFVLGFATATGGRTSHAAIMARSLGIPAVVGVEGLLEAVPDGATVVINGQDGIIHVNPEPGVLQASEEQIGAYRARQEELIGLVAAPATTLDGRTVEMAANIGTPGEAALGLAKGAEGIGLFRSEFLFMDREQMPSEEEQYEAYKAALAAMGGRPVIIRTLDVGGDKQIPYLDMPAEENPFLGWRGLRMCLDRPVLFKTQLRALWRAGRHGNLRVMFPMVSGVGEVRLTRALLEEARKELVSAGFEVADSLPVGVMIEIPSAALITDKLASEVDFFSIGSNDLVQYTLAADRMNQQVAGLYSPLHPAVLRLISTVIDSAHRHGKWVGMCGEMAADLDAVPILIGLGLDEFSMSASSILEVKELIRRLSYAECRTLAFEALEQESPEQVKSLIKRHCAHVARS